MDARIIKTTNKIKDALLLILRTKKVNEVSISEICKTAKVNRNTFYAHFATPEAVFDEIAEEYLSEEYALLEQASTTKEIVVTACKYIKEHSNKNLILLENRALQFFIEKGVEYEEKNPIYIVDNKEKRLTPEVVHMIHTYIVSGAVAIIKEWLYSGMKESPKKIGETVDLIITSLIAGIKQHPRG